MNLFVCILFLHCLTIISTDVIVETKLGKIAGIEIQSIIPNEKYYSFLGIPYAKPPIDELRFKTPKPHEESEHLAVDTDDSRAVQRGLVAFGPSIEPNHPEAVITDLPEDNDIEINVPVMIGYNSREDGTWGASVGDELCYLFVCNPKKIYKKLLEDEDAEEIKVLKNMVKMWANFARTGNPTPNGDEVTWNPATKENKECLVISDELKMHKNLHENVVRFWDDFISSYSEKAVNGVVQDKRDEL
ncbi:unnamed protein product, partial [Iphiclides podalirius]